MEQKVEISNREWQEVTEGVHSNGEQIEYLKKRVEGHSERLDTIEDLQKTLPISIQSSITEALMPLNEKNERLQEKVIDLENQKYKQAYETNRKILWSVVGTVITVVVGYIVNKYML